MSRSLADRLRRRTASDDGFGLIELMIAMLIFGIVAVATAPLFVGGLKAGRAAQLHLQGKSLGQERLEKLRNMPFHVARQNGQYLDVLDVYFRDLQASGSLAANDVCSTRTYDATAKSYACTITALGSAYTGFKQVVTSQFLSAERAVMTPRAAYNSQSTSDDAPVSNLLSTTVVTSWKQAGKNRSFTLRSLISNSQADPNVINVSIRASAVDITSNLDSGDVLQFEGGLVSGEGALNSGSTASLSVAAARGGLASGISTSGASLSLTAPPAAAGTSPSVGGQFLDGSSCTLVCFGDTAVSGDQSVDVASGLPKVSAVGTPVAGTLKRTGTGSFRGFSYSNATGSAVRPALQLDPGLPMVSAVQAPGGSTVLSGGGYIDGTGTGASAVRSKAAVALNELDLFPTTLASGSAVLRVELTAASVTCQSGGGATNVSATWAGRVGYWSTAMNGYVYFDLGPDKAPLPSPSTLMVAPGLPLSTWVQTWSALTDAATVSESAGAQAKGNMNPVLSILTVPTRADAASPLNIAIGSLACTAMDIR